ncbi:MAG: hypothetical protein M3P93_18395, partial [Actinomycetota bacterium]|nr:hypothetical protein [Actinomycetota bacterium]
MPPATGPVRALPRLLLGAAVALVLALLLVRVTGAERGTALQVLMGALPVALLVAYPLLAGALLLRARWQAVGA